MALEDKGRALPKFGEWDVNNPATSEGFTVIFNKARDEKKTNRASVTLITPRKSDIHYKDDTFQQYPEKKKWLCCGGNLVCFNSDDRSPSRVSNVTQNQGDLSKQLSKSKLNVMASCDMGELRKLEEELEKVLEQEETMWKQRSRVQWLKEGDRNTNCQVLLKSLHLFFPPPIDEFEDLVPKRVTEEMKLKRLFFRWDGFYAIFYQKYGKIVGDDVCSMVLNILNNNLYEGPQSYPHWAYPEN
ncbi:RPM1-interacting protein 4-like [Senna tora]|uniref:RPM1-interacting protein 4-like n=1 Tax=Senna tora TaxID=362788 RepID=A0A834X696_9FABA|nr:RPM1-interacting protein 4-like [Senna tora]